MMMGIGYSNNNSATTSTKSNIYFNMYITRKRL